MHGFVPCNLDRVFCSHIGLGSWDLVNCAIYLDFVRITILCFLSFVIKGGFVQSLLGFSQCGLRMFLFSQLSLRLGNSIFGESLASRYVEVETC